MVCEHEPSDRPVGRVSVRTFIKDTASRKILVECYPAGIAAGGKQSKSSISCWIRYYGNKVHHKRHKGHKEELQIFPSLRSLRLGESDEPQI